jgi:tetratricopeptide (TPR) repeat protein
MTPNELYKVHQNLGKVYYRKSDYQKAIESYQKALELCDSDYKVYYDLASAYVSVKDYNKAIKHFKMALDLKNNDLYTLNSLASVYIACKNYEAATELAFIIESQDSFLANKLFKQIENKS